MASQAAAQGSQNIDDAAFEGRSELSSVSAGSQPESGADVARAAYTKTAHPLVLSPAAPAVELRVASIATRSALGVESVAPHLRGAKALFALV